MSDDELVAYFEAGDEPPCGFHHGEHVRVAWVYLRRESMPAALERFRTGLRRFAAAHGKPERYHETITTAYVLLIHERMMRRPVLTWEEFAAAHDDLLAWSPSILLLSARDAGVGACAAGVRRAGRGECERRASVLRARVNASTGADRSELAGRRSGS
jgi:hypothetical protein